MMTGISRAYSKELSLPFGEREPAREELCRRRIRPCARRRRIEARGAVENHSDEAPRIVGDAARADHDASSRRRSLDLERYTDRADRSRVRRTSIDEESE